MKLWKLANWYERAKLRLARWLILSCASKRHSHGFNHLLEDAFVSAGDAMRIIHPGPAPRIVTEDELLASLRREFHR